MALRDRLLEAHVAFEMRQLRGERFPELVAGEVDHALRAAGGLTLDQVMHRDQVTEVARKYVTTFRLPGAIPEVAGEIARRVRSHPANDMLLGDLISRSSVQELVTVVAEMRALRERVLRGVADSASLQAGVGGMVHGLATGALGSSRRLAGRIPVVGSGLDVAERLAAGLVEGVDQRSRELAEEAARLLLTYLGDSAATAISDEELREAVLEVWDALATRPVSDLLAAVTDDDMVDLLVAVFEVWLDLRASGYVMALVESGVEFFFDTYGGFTLDRLLEEFGLGRDDLVEEALRFGPSVIEALAEAGVLEELLRRRLGSFYSSPEARGLLPD